LKIDSTTAYVQNVPYVNTGQPFSTPVTISNDGDEAVNDIWVHLQTDGGSVIELDSILIVTLLGDSSNTVTFNIEAGALPDTSEIFTSSLSGGIGGVSGNPVQILQPDDNTSNIVIQEPAELSLDSLSVVSPPEALDDTVAVDQIITISTFVENHGQAGLDGEQYLSLVVGNSGFLPTDSIYTRYFELDEPVIWEIMAPSYTVDSAEISIRFANEIYDINDSSSAIGQDSVSFRIFTVNDEATLEQSVSVTDPPGAVDQIVSTDQIFTITNILEPSGLYEDLTSEINLPDGFSSLDPVLVYPENDTITWRIKAPVSAGYDTILITSWLIDINNGEIDSVENYLSIETMWKANLNLSSSITAPNTAIDGIVEPGSQFTYTAVVTNQGDAQVGTGLLRLHLDPELYSPNEVQSFVAGIPVDWQIVVPDYEITEPIVIGTTIDSIPYDSNTNMPAFVTNGSSEVSIVIRNLLPQLIFNPANIYDGSAVRGQPFNLMSFNLRNQDNGGTYSIDLTEIAFRIPTNPSNDLSSAFSAINILASGVIINYSSVSGDTVMFDFENALNIPPDASIDLSLMVTPANNATISDFSGFISGDMIQGVIFDEGVLVDSLNAVDNSGENFEFQTNPVALLEGSFSGSISSYPNPFNPRIEQATIGYFLTVDSDIEVKLFTLLGELVWSREISQNDALGTQGLHTGSSALKWDGKNDNGSEVRSGVYICLVTNLTTGEEEQLKIAVVK
jgi:hypothetical protein